MSSSLRRDNPFLVCAGMDKNEEGLMKRILVVLALMVSFAYPSTVLYIGNGGQVYDGAYAPPYTLSVDGDEILAVC